MNLYNNPPPNITQPPQISYYNQPTPNIRQPRWPRVQRFVDQVWHGWRGFKELLWDDVMKTQVLIAAIKIIAWWLFKHL